MIRLFAPISAFYFFYFAVLGAIVPYLGLYLQQAGFSATEIGELIALVSITKIISPNLSSWVADRFGHNMRLVRYSAFISLLFFALIFYQYNYFGYFIIILGFSFFWNASLPQFEVNTFEHLGKSYIEKYSKIRVWGSLGFILTVFILGLLIQHYGITILPYSISILFLMLWFSSLLVVEAQVHQNHLDKPGFWSLIKQRKVVVLLIVIFLIQLSHGAYYSFFSIFLQEYGYSKTLTGFLWSISVIAEVIAFLLMGKIIHYFGIRKIFVFSLIATSIRWLMVAFFVDYPVIMLFSQLFHAASFGIFHVSCVYMINDYFSPYHKSKGQALYVSIGFGLGGALGSYLAGLKWEQWGGSNVFLVFSLFSLLAYSIFMFFSSKKTVALAS